jgi:hypothetical protein
MSIGHETPPSEARIDLAKIENMRRWTDRFKVGMFWDLLAELKRCYYEIDLLQEYAKCGNCGGRYIGPMDYGLHEQEHSEDCDFYHDNASE